MCNSRRLLTTTVMDEAGLRRGLQVVAVPAGQPDAGNSPFAAPPPFIPQRQANASAFDTLDPTVVIILVVLLFALICAAFLNSVMRCLLRRALGQRRGAPVGGGGRGQVVHSSMQGLDPKTMASLPIFTLKATDKLPKESPGDCTICLTEFGENEKLRLLPKCSHVFHLDCIDMWLRSHVSCPVCRDGIADDEDNLNAIGSDDEQPAAQHDSGAMILIHDQHGHPSLTTAAAAIGSGTSIPRAELTLLGDNSDRRNPADSTIVSSLPRQEATCSRRTLRSTLSSMFTTEIIFSGRWQAVSSSSAAVAPTTTATVTNSVA